MPAVHLRLDFIYRKLWDVQKLRRHAGVPFKAAFLIHEVMGAQNTRPGQDGLLCCSGRQIGKETVADVPAPGSLW